MSDRVGQQLGNYRLLHLLGQGSFAQVYLAEHMHLGTQAAIKLLHTQLADEDVEKFRHEARTLARLEHAHIVRVLDFDVKDGTPFLVMTYASGGTLREAHPKGTQLPLDHDAGTSPRCKRAGDDIYTGLGRAIVGSSSEVTCYLSSWTDGT